MIPIRFEPESFMRYVDLLLIRSVVKQPGRHLRTVVFLGKQETGKTWSICRMAEWIEENLSKHGLTVGIKVLDVDITIKSEYRAKSLWDLTYWVENEEYDVMVAAIGEAGEFLPSVFLDSEEYYEVMSTVRRFFQARHYTKAKNLYYLLGVQVPKSFAAWIRRLSDLYVFKGLPRELALEVISLLKLNANEELINEISKLYKEVFLHGRKDKAVGVSSDISGRMYFSPPQKIVDPKYIDREWVNYLRKLREIEEDKEHEPRKLKKKKVFEELTRKITGTTGKYVSIPRVWLDLMGARDHVTIQLVQVDGTYAVLVKPLKKKSKVRGVLDKLANII